MDISVTPVTDHRRAFLAVRIQATLNRQTQQAAEPALSTTSPERHRGAAPCLCPCFPISCSDESDAGTQISTVADDRTLRR